MKEEQLSKLNNMELLKKTKDQKFVTGILILIVTIMFAYVFIISPENKSAALKLLPFAFLPHVTLNIMDIQRLIKEIKSR